ncbi:MAG: hypothetical protein GY757_50090 [bacterium]|nr:hypothetical protein [bacterium]
MAAIWRSILKVEDIGVRDDFFQLGGHSLDVILLAREIRTIFNVELPVPELFRYSNIDEMARFISDGMAGAVAVPGPEQPVLLNAPGMPEVFMFPPQIGYGLVYKEMVNYIPEWSLYAFNYLEIEERMEVYARQVAALQKGDSCVVFGYSAGGNLAYDVVRAIEAEGGVVSDLVIMDSFSRVSAIMPEREELIREFLVEVEADIERMGIGYLKEQVVARVRAYTLCHDASVTRGRVNAHIHLITGDDREQRREALRPVDGRILGPSGRGFYESTDWEDFTTAGCTVYRGHGDHIDMLNAPNMEKNMALLKKILDKVNQ